MCEVEHKTRSPAVVRIANRTAWQVGNTQFERPLFFLERGRQKVGYGGTVG